MFSSVGNGYHAPYPSSEAPERDGNLNIASQFPDRLTSASLSREFGHHTKVLDDDFVVVWLLICLIDECIKFYDLKSDQIFEIESVQENNKMVGEIASEIRRIRDDLNFDESQLISLVEKFGVSVDFTLKSLRNFTHIAGCSDLCNLYEKLKFYSEKQRLNIVNIRNLSTSNQPLFETSSQPFYSHPALSMPFQEATEELKCNRQFVIAAVRQNGLALQHVSKAFKKDSEIVFEAASQNVLALQYACQELRNNWEFMFKAVLHFAQKEYYSIEGKKEFFLICGHLSEILNAMNFLRPIAFTECKNNRELLLRNVMCQGSWLMLANEHLKNDRELVLAAVNQDGFALEFAGDDLKNNKDVAEAAMKQNWKALEFAGQQLQEDEQFMLAAIKQNWKAIKFASQRLKDDRHFMSAIILSEANQPLSGCWRVIPFVSDRLKDDEEFALEVVRDWGGAFQYFSERLRTNQEFCLKVGLRHEDPIFTDESTVDSDRSQTIARYQEEVDNKIKNILFELAEVVSEIQQLNYNPDANLLFLSKDQEEEEAEKLKKFNRCNELQISLSRRLFQLQDEARELTQLKNKKY